MEKQVTNYGLELDIKYGECTKKKKTACLMSAIMNTHHRTNPLYTVFQKSSLL